MSLGDYLAGAGFLGGTGAGVAVITWVIARRCLGHHTGAPRLLAWATVATATVVFVHLIPGMLNVLGRGAVLATSLLGAVTVWLTIRGAAPSEPEPTRAPQRQEQRVSVAITGIAVLALGICVAGTLRDKLLTAVDVTDYVTFHAPGMARWIQDGGIWANTNFAPQFPIGQYPNTGNLVALASVLPFHNDAFVRLVNLPFVALLGVAIYAVARELGSGPAAGTLAATLVLALPKVNAPALNALPDVILLFGFATGVLFGLRHLRTGARSDLVLAGVSLGLAFGTKWYGVSATVVVVLAWALVMLVRRVAARRLAADLGLLGGTILAVGGVWLLRNWVTVGNPLFPVKLAPFGVTIFDAPRDIYRERYGFTIANHLGDPRFLADFVLPGWRDAVGLPGAVLLAGVLGALALGVVTRVRRGRWQPASAAQFGMALAALALLGAYMITPGTAQGLRGHPFGGLIAGNSRYGIAALVVAAPVTAVLIGRLGRLRPAADLIALIAVLEGLHRSFGYVPAGSLLVAAVALAVLIAGALVVRRVIEGGGPLSRVALTATAALVAAIAVVVGQLGQRRLNAHRYEGYSQTVSWLVAHAVTGHRVGVAGGWRADLELVPIFPAFGPRLGNRVAYVGPTVKGMLQRYRSEQPFVAALRRGRYDILIVGRGVPPVVMPPEERWAQSAGFSPVAGSRQYRVLARSRAPA